MKGTIIGDVSGSKYEFNNTYDEHFKDFIDYYKCNFTDDSVLTLAVMKYLLDLHFDKVAGNFAQYLKIFATKYPHRGYGHRFKEWVYYESEEPYNSFGNGSAMRAGACAYYSEDLEECRKVTKEVTIPTHNHPEGIKGALATTDAIFYARHGKTKEFILKQINKDYGYLYDDSCLLIKQFGVSCQVTMPKVLYAFSQGTSYEDSIRKVISYGGDSDTYAAILGGICEAFYKSDRNFIDTTFEDSYKYRVIDARFYSIVSAFYKTFVK
ncbi:MAG: ADP-ribosylglycohydrolase family protein [Erysipelotrichaceae bacterium]|jgi:type I restriction enzyme M protein|nr:ADP-ribosylglycohydrolase family protein [Erysipelotrichaceae bacterium]MCB9499817.1 ADP-ribosylglycohydrolase family protein [Erysipelotrichaceae bacterium]